MKGRNLKKIQLIKCIIPFYLKYGGDCTKVYTGDKCIFLKMPIIKSLDYLYEKCMDDAIKVRFNETELGKIMGIKENITIILSYKDILLRLKVRNPRLKNDSAYGYFNIRFIKEIKELNGGRCLLKFKSGLKFIVMNRLCRVNELKKISELISLVLIQEREIEYIKNRLCKEANLLYDRHSKFYFDTCY